MAGPVQEAAEAAAVAKSGEVAVPAVSITRIAEDAVRNNLERFQAVLPRGWDKDRFQNLVITAVKREPKLLSCFTTQGGRLSLLVAAMQCATIGLEPNTPLREASLVPRKNKGIDECQLMIEYRGLIKLARRSGELSTIDAEVVHERDHFYYEKGLKPILEHRPYDGDDDPGPLKYCYCVATFKDGGIQFVVVPRRVVYNDHRAKSDSWKSESSRPYSPWTVFEESMWRKTAVRVMEPFLPLTSEARLGFESDDRRFVIEHDAIVPVEDRDGRVDDVSPPSLPANVDASTGEIDPGSVVEASTAVECDGTASCQAATHLDGCFAVTELEPDAGFPAHDPDFPDVDRRTGDERETTEGPAAELPLGRS